MGAASDGSGTTCTCPPCSHTLHSSKPSEHPHCSKTSTDAKYKCPGSPSHAPQLTGCSLENCKAFGICERRQASVGR